MFLNEMRIGKSVEVFVYRDEYKYRLVSKIEDVNHDNFSITLIANRRNVFQFQETDKIEILYRINEQLWRWKHLKAKVVIIDGTRVHRFSLSGNTEGERYNRRNAFRVFLGEDVTLIYYKPNLLYRNLENNGNDLKEENGVPYEIEYEEKKCTGFIKDLSENGVGIFSNNVFDIGEEIEFSLDTPFGRLNSKAEVVRVSKETHGAFLNFYGCAFVTSSKNIVKYIYTLQRQKINNMKG